MASQPPHRLNPDTPLDQNLALINDNFDKVVQNVTDLGARNSSTIEVTFAAVASGASFRQTVNLILPTGSGSSTIITGNNISGVSALTPIADVYVDTDNNAAFLWPSGASLSGAQLNFLISFVQSFTTPTGTLASITINGRNKDVGAHTYFVHFAVSYFPAGPTGVYR